jgi:hypothetical protein
MHLGRWIVRSALALALVTWGAGCASRGLPSAMPEGSAASLEAPPAAMHDVEASLSSDPPLPGESTARWRGLDADAGRSAGHAHHHHHHGSEEPGSGAEAPESPRDEGAEAAAEEEPHHAP